MPTKAKAKRLPNKKVLETICAGLEEIKVYFDWQPSLAGSAGKPAEEVEAEGHDLEEAEAADAPSEEAYDEGTSEVEYFDREEIEVTIDAFISVLLTEGIIHKGPSGKMPSFYTVFDKFFDKDHEIVELAWSFEQDIKGYFGWVSPEDMQMARDCFLAIRELVQELLAGGPDVD